MSTKSIKLFQSAYPQHKPSLQVRLRNEAAKLRAKAQSILAQANVLEETASELESEARCVCGAELRWDADQGVLWCTTCEGRSERDGAAINVYGRGSTKAAALADWRRQQGNF